MMDWNALYSNEQPPSLEQVTEYNTAVVPCRQAGILSIKKVESLFVRSIRCKAILSLS